MRTSVASLSPPSSGTQAATCLLVRPAASAMSDAIMDGLRAAGLRVAGLRVAAVSNVFDAVIEAEHAARGHPGSPARALTHLVVGVDHFGQQEFRLFPLVRREWPGTLIVAFHSPGFDYKGRLAELLGADVILGSTDSVAEWTANLMPPAAPAPPILETPPAETPVRVEPPARPAPEPPPLPAAPTGQPPAEAYQYLARAPEPPSAPPAQAVAPTDRTSVNGAGQAAPPAASAATPAPPPSAAPGPRLTPAAEAVAALLKSLPHRFAPKTAMPSHPPARDELAGGDVIGTIELTEDELRLLLGEEKDA
jgi:hypothetical protein